MDTNRDQNAVYLKVIQDTKDTFCPFRKEYQMEVIEEHLKKDLEGKNGVEILEAACGQGRLLYYLNQFDSKQNYTGFDYSNEFVEDAKKLFEGVENISCVYGDMYDLPESMQKKYDISLLYKTLIVLPDYEAVFRALFKVTKKKIYITTSAYEGDIDFEVKMKPHKVYKDDSDYLTYYIYSLPRLIECSKKLGAKKVTAYDLKLPIDLPRSVDPDILNTYTIRAQNGDNLEFTNIVKLDWKLIEIEL
jgi:ubiquinone/menaquinone biosynthesis C-methylase UbiE